MYSCMLSLVTSILILSWTVIGIYIYRLVKSIIMYRLTVHVHHASCNLFTQYMVQLSSEPTSSYFLSTQVTRRSQLSPTHSSPQPSAFPSIQSLNNQSNQSNNIIHSNRHIEVTMTGASHPADWLVCSAHIYYFYYFFTSKRWTLPRALTSLILSQSRNSK